MNEGAILDLWRGALTTVATVAAPFVLVAMVVGLAASLLQAITQLQENALSFVPKVVAVGMVLALGGPWALGQLTRYTGEAAAALVRIGQEGRR